MWGLYCVAASDARCAVSDCSLTFVAVREVVRAVKKRTCELLDDMLCELLRLDIIAQRCYLHVSLAYPIRFPFLGAGFPVYSSTDTHN